MSQNRQLQRLNKCMDCYQFFFPANLSDNLEYFECRLQKLAYRVFIQFSLLSEHKSLFQSSHHHTAHKAGRSSKIGVVFSKLTPHSLQWQLVMVLLRRNATVATNLKSIKKVRNFPVDIVFLCLSKQIYSFLKFFLAVENSFTIFFSS